MTDQSRQWSAMEFLEHLGLVSEAVAFQAGVGGMEIAGAIASYLIEHPDKIGAFMDGGFFELPFDMHAHGRLSWHGMNGKIITPEFSRRARVIKALEKGQPS